jgi:class 3 adenylate cyclase
MSPEQARGETIDARSDLFALGSLFYQLFTGVSPFLAESAVETLARVGHHDPEPVRRRRPELPEALDRWIGRLLAKDPADRPRAAHEVVAALEGLLRTAGGPGPSGEAGSTSGVRFERPGDPAGDPGVDPGGGLRGELRQLTVVCAELMGRVDGDDGDSGSLDPETLLEVLPPFRARLHQILDRYGGYPGDFGGHRIGLYFGWPLAREDGALRAVATALELAALGDELDDPRPESGGLTVRAGVHAGPVVVLATSDGRERLALGETWDRTLELRDRAGAGEVRISPALRRRVVEHFPDVRGARPRPSDLPTVGRERELDLLHERLRLAAEGLGQAVSITAEGGVGKTHLLRALRERAAAESADDDPRGPGGSGGPTCWTVRGSSFRPCEPLAPLVELTRRALDLDDPTRDGGEAWEERLVNALEVRDLPTEDLLPTLGPWLGAPDLEAPHLEAPNRETREAVRLWPELFLELVEQRFEVEGPTILIVEDLQWIDSATLEVLGALLERCAGSPLLLLLTSRPEFQSPWGSARNRTHLRLDPLDPARCLELLDPLDGPIDDDARQALVERAGGIPLYLEELVRAARGETPLFPGSEVPSSLFDGLAARLDRLGTARELARIAALFPGDFSESELRRLRLFDPTRLEHEVGRLLDGRAWVTVRDGPGDRVHRFAHPLLREVALASLPMDERTELATRIETVRTVG